MSGEMDAEALANLGDALRAFVARAWQEDMGLAHDLLAEVLDEYGIEIAGVNASDPDGGSR